MRKFILLMTHVIALIAGFALGVYFLPILTAPASPDSATLQEMAGKAEFSVKLSRDKPGNDFLHWGEGTISLSASEIVHQGKLAPGPDYKLYLVNGPVEHEDDFLPLKDGAVQIGDVKSFDGFIVPVPEGVDIAAYTTVVVWCEAFSEYITAGSYR